MPTPGGDKMQCVYIDFMLIQISKQFFKSPFSLFYSDDINIHRRILGRTIVEEGARPILHLSWCAWEGSNGDARAATSISYEGRGTMTQSFDAAINEVFIPAGQNATRWIYGAYEYNDATCIVIQSPSSLDAQTYTIETSFDGITGGTLNDGTNDIGPPATGKTRQYTEMLGARYWRIKSSGNAASNRIFLVSKQWTS